MTYNRDKYPDQRPKASKEFWDNWTSDDFYTRSDIKMEHCPSDCFKVILLMCEQLMMVDRLQKEDILAVIKSDLDRHYDEEDVK